MHNIGCKIRCQTWRFIILMSICFVPGLLFGQPLTDKTINETPLYENNKDSCQKRKLDFPIAIKTNLLYDAALVPNIGVEFFFNSKWSVAANWMYAWWKNDNKHWYWRVYGGDIEGRWWFGKDGYGVNYTGHHLGVYAQAGTFDFELGGRGQMVDKWSFGGGFSYGYSVRLAERLNMDFLIGLGYFRADYKEYLPHDSHYVWMRTTRRNWIGPTKAEVSLVWIIGDNKW